MQKSLPNALVYVLTANDSRGVSESRGADPLLRAGAKSSPCRRCQRPAPASFCRLQMATAPKSPSGARSGPPLNQPRRLSLGAQRAHTAARLSSQRRSSCAQCRLSPASSSAPANTPCQADLEALRQGPCAALSLEPLAAFACRSQTREPGVAHANSLSTYGSARALLD